MSGIMMAIMNNVAPVTAEIPAPILYLDALAYSGSGTTWPAETGSNGTLAPTAASYTAPSPTYFSFNGTNQIAYTANLKASFASSNSQTLEIWVRTASDNGVVISQQGASPINTGYHLSVMEIVAGELKVGLWQEPGNIANVTVGTVTRNEWQQYVLTYNDSTNTLTGYINAASPVSTTLENAPPTPEWYYALCQADGTSMGDGGYLAADVGLFRVYNQALTSAQVQELYNENLARFSLTPTTITFTDVGITSWEVPAGVNRVEYLVVGGGGGGATGYDTGAGGGGGGGMVLSGVSDVLFSEQLYNVEVGDGGVGGPATQTNTAGSPGGASGIDFVATALGGIGGQGSRTFSPSLRYTGGAAQVSDTTAPRGGGGGGSGGGSGGGGGASGAGGNSGASPTAGGTGGAGIASSITGSSVTYGVGGAGAQGNTAVTGAPGASNTGQGGGGGSFGSGGGRAGGKGGSGIVVIRYGS